MVKKGRSGTTDYAYFSKKEQYLLRATFIRRRLKTDGYYRLLDEVQSIVKAQGKKISWDDKSEWGISDDAWDIVFTSAVDPLLLFCHPKILNQHPTTLRYYRSVTLLPQKGFTALIPHNPNPYENGKKVAGKIPKDECLTIVRGLNEIVSNTLAQGTDITPFEVKGMFFAQAGSTVDGGWRNQIGAEGQLLIWNMILRGLLKSSEVESVSASSGRGDTLVRDIDAKDLIENSSEYRCLNLTNGSSVLYAAEPDIILQSSSGDMLGAMEIKSGLDPAGALERVGAVLKTFESALCEYPDATTILVSSCETSESKLRFNESRAVHHTYLTADITTNASQERKFITLVRRTLKLIS